MANRTCERCGHTMRMLKFKGETTRRLTCPDCGWRRKALDQTLTYEGMMRAMDDVNDGGDDNPAQFSNDNA